MTPINQFAQTCVEAIEQRLKKMACCDPLAFGLSAATDIIRAEASKAEEVAKTGEWTEHALKVWPAYFDALESGMKAFELRLNDRDFKAGDVLRLREWNPETELFSGREIKRTVTYIIEGEFGLLPRYVCMALGEQPQPAEQPTSELRYATQLARAIWARHYSQTAPQWEPLTDLYGVLSQIDNMVTGWKPAEPVAQPVAQESRAEFKAWMKSINHGSHLSLDSLVYAAYQAGQAARAMSSADAKRIDWLEANPGFKISWCFTPKDKSGEYTRTGRNYWEVETKDDELSEGDSLREAIDAAKAEGEQL